MTARFSATLLPEVQKFTQCGSGTEYEPSTAVHARRQRRIGQVKQITIEHLDHSEITRTVEEAIRRQRLAEPGTRNPQELLIGLGLIRDGEILNAAVVLFGQTDHLLPDYTQCLLRMARFRESWGRGTLKMAELIAEAGLAPPEFESSDGHVMVRFYPTRYVPPTRVSHDLSPLQREPLNVLAQAGTASLSQVRAHLTLSSPEGTVRDNLDMLRRLDLVEVVGTGRGARWRLKGVLP